MDNMDGGSGSGSGIDMLSPSPSPYLSPSPSPSLSPSPFSTLSLSPSPTVISAEDDDSENVALGVGLSVGLYILVCILMPLVVYIVVWCFRDGPLRGWIEPYVPRSRRSVRSRETATSKPVTANTQSIELGSDYPPVYPMKEVVKPAMATTAHVTVTMTPATQHEQRSETPTKVV